MRHDLIENLYVHIHKEIIEFCKKCMVRVTAMIQRIGCAALDAFSADYANKAPYTVGPSGSEHFGRMSKKSAPSYLYMR